MLKRLARIMLGFTLLVTTTGLGACAASQDAGGASSGSGEGGPFPVTLTTATGEVTIEQRPQRVVALGWSDAETALALGVQPVGASDWLDFGGTGVGPWARDLYTEPPELVGTQEVDLEKVAALRPDVILNTRADVDKSTHEKLSEIAPVVSPPPDTIPYGTSWQRQMTMVSKALGKPDKGERLITETAKSFTQATAEHPEFAGKTTVVGSYYGGKFGAYANGDSRVRFMKRLGFQSKPKVDELADGSFSVQLSDERLDLLSADLTVMLPIGGNADQLRQNKLLDRISSAKSGHLVILDDKTLVSAFSSGSVLAIRYALDHAVPAFAEALNR